MDCSRLIFFVLGCAITYSCSSSSTPEHTPQKVNYFSPPIAPLTRSMIIQMTMDTKTTSIMTYFDTLEKLLPEIISKQVRTKKLDDPSYLSSILRVQERVASLISDQSGNQISMKELEQVNTAIWSILIHFYRNTKNSSTKDEILSLWNKGLSSLRNSISQISALHNQFDNDFVTSHFIGKFISERSQLFLMATGYALYRNATDWEIQLITRKLNSIAVESRTAHYLGMALSWNRCYTKDKCKSHEPPFPMPQQVFYSDGDAQVEANKSPNIFGDPINYEVRRMRRLIEMGK